MDYMDSDVDILDVPREEIYKMLNAVDSLFEERAANFSIIKKGGKDWKTVWEKYKTEWNERFSEMKNMFCRNYSKDVFDCVYRSVVFWWLDKLYGDKFKDDGVSPYDVFRIEFVDNPEEMVD